MMTSTKPQASLRDVFAQNVRAAQTELGISQERLAEMAEFHRTYVSQVERGVSNVTLDNVQKLADVLQTEAWKLMRPL